MGKVYRVGTSKKNGENAAAVRREAAAARKTGHGLPHGQNPLTSDNIQYTADEIEFSTALDRYRREKNRKFLINREVLQVLLSLGYRKGTKPPPAKEASP